MYSVYNGHRRHTLAVVLFTFFVAIPSILIGVNCGITEPASADGDDLKKLIDKLELMPDRDKKRAYRHTANRNAAEHFRGKEDERFGVVHCADEDAVKETPVEGDDTYELWDMEWTVYDLLQCLDEDLMENTYKECERRLLAEARKGFVAEIGASRPDCKWVGRPKYHENVPPEFDPDSLEMQDNVRVILQSSEPPPWMKDAVIITAAGAAILLLPFLLPSLCVLSEGPDWSCPGNPFYPGDAPSATSSGSGGDQ